MEFIIENLGKIGFEWKMALFQLINFLILFAILKKYFFAPIVKTLDERKSLAKESVENFEKSKTELSMAEQKAQGIIDDAKVDANKVIEKSADDARAMTEKMKEKAKSEIELLVTQAKKNIEIDRQEMQEALRAETVDLVIATTKAVLGDKIDSTVDAKLIQDSMNK